MVDCVWVQLVTGYKSMNLISPYMFHHLMSLITFFELMSKIETHQIQETKPYMHASFRPYSRVLPSKKFKA